jgi:F0F1-type ATP synthase membrane subunit b/b'
MNDNSNNVVNTISETLHQEAQVTIAEKKSALETLRKQYKEQRDSFNKRIETIRDYKNELLTV